jgi:hypothetical protein
LPQLPPVVLITKKETARRRGVHPEHLMRLVREERFPQPIRPTDSRRGRVYFIESEVEEHLRTLREARDRGRKRGDGADESPPP